MAKRKPKPKRYVCPKCGHIEIQDIDIEPIEVSHVYDDLGKKTRHIMKRKEDPVGTSNDS